MGVKEQIIIKINRKKMTEFNNEFSREVFDITYRYKDESLDGMIRRVSHAVANIEEKNKEEWEEKFYDLLSEFKAVPGGRILSNAGTEIKGATLLNCYVDGFIGEDKDSMNGIMDALKRQALILKSEGGYGFNIGVLRPRNSYIEGIRNQSPGSIKMLEMWDTTSNVITSGGDKLSDKKGAKKKIRKGAQLVCLPIWHPDIEEFITAKQTPGRLTKFNMSVGITDEFMNAVIEHKTWNLEFPDYDHPVALLNSNQEEKSVKDLYKEQWDGNLKAWKEKKYPTKIYKTFKDANELWELIMQSTYNRNEPGVLFLDTINRLNNLWYVEYIDTTNPCGEVPLPIGSVCLLMAINLTQYVNESLTDWDYEKLERDIPIIIRFMDNVNEIANVPLPHQKIEMLNKRRLGFGRMGYASALLMMKKRYGSEKALELTEKLESFICNKAYMASADLAKEKGCFPLYDKEKFLQSKFLKILDKDTIEYIKKNGMRNSHLIALAPTGNTSIVANNVSGGIEPIISMEYVRYFITSMIPKGLDLPYQIDWKNKLFKSSSKWKWIKEGDDNLLMIEFDGDKYKYDENRGLTKEASVRDYGYNYLVKYNLLDKNADYLPDINNLTVDDHVNTLKIITKYVDQAVSKTINLPNEYSYEDFKNVYLDLYNSGTIKGGTSYRWGTMMSVISTNDNKSDSRDQDILIKTHAPKRPKKLKCDIHHVTARGKEWVVLVGCMNGERNPVTPYEVFAFKKKNINISSKITEGYLIKVKSGCYNLELDVITLEDVTKLFEQDEEEALTRMISISMRHGVDITFIVEQLNKSEGNIASFSKAIARTLKKYILDDVDVGEKCPNCGDDLIYIEGCVKCKSCIFSKC